MNKYPVIKEFTDNNGDHKVGESIELVNTRAAKLISLGKVGSAIVEKATEAKTVEVNLTGSEEVQELLEKANGIIELRDKEIFSLIESSNKLTEVNETLKTELTEANEDLLNAQTNIQNISTALIGAKTLADYKEVSISLVEAIEKAKSDSETEEN